MNNPISLTDPTGLGPCFTIGGWPTLSDNTAFGARMVCPSPAPSPSMPGGGGGYGFGTDNNMMYGGAPGHVGADRGGGFATREGRDFAGSPTGPQNTFGGRSDWKDGRRDERDGGDEMSGGRRPAS